ncbi:hypothetical protein ATJ97_1331 [Georgenia soli]|uniref:N-acetyltransferase domain-containing protein n=1 Tax=Georgenia soli TaxID=638953 RepID=A0A2A9EJ49_9MICO|nr:hypothetical protein [Georgenia soli]PFG38843.1 hypothetical protein ATJ97_1331 [Georgenia soli]
MPVGPPVELGPIQAADVAAVGRFLHAHLNPRLDARAWADALVPPWSVKDRPNHGFLLRAGDEIVGAYLAFYSERLIEGRTERFCNLAAWCVADEHRVHGLRLLRAALRQQGYHFTDLSPSGNVVEVNTRLKFTTLDTTTDLVPNLPWPPSRTVRLLTRRADIEATLTGRALQIYRDHAGAAAARHLVVVRDGRPCHVIFRRDRRKNLPLFASILHVGDREVFRDADRHVFAHLLTQGAALTLAERRVLGYRPAASVPLRRARPKMFRSPTLRPDQIDYLYSELTCVPW